MADTKLSAHPLLTTPAANSRLYIIKVEGGVWEMYGITLQALFGNVPANTALTGTLEVDGSVTFNTTLTVSGNTVFSSRTSADQLTVANTFVLSDKQTPANSSFVSTQGRILFDANYLYVATANNTLKRVALSSF